jgi:hypothetical protein
VDSTTGDSGTLLSWSLTITGAAGATTAGAKSAMFEPTLASSSLLTVSGLGAQVDPAQGLTPTTSEPGEALRALRTEKATIAELPPVIVAPPQSESGIDHSSSPSTSAELRDAVWLSRLPRGSDDGIDWITDLGFAAE